MAIGTRLKNAFFDPRLKTATTESWQILRESVRWPRRLSKADEALLKQDFNVLLVRWGLTLAEIEPVIHRMGVEIMLWAIVGVAGLGFASLSAWGGHSLETLFSLAWLMVSLVKIFGISWYRAVLRHRRFVPFVEWVGLNNSKKVGDT